MLTCTPDTSAQVDTKVMGPRLDAKAGKMITKGGYQKYNPGSTPVEGEVRKTAPFHDAARSPKNGSNHGNMAQAVLKRLLEVQTGLKTHISSIQQNSAAAALPPYLALAVVFAKDPVQARPRAVPNANSPARSKVLLRPEEPTC